MSIEGDIDNLIDSLSFSAIIQWCATYDIPCHPEEWGDDEYPDKEDELRVQVKDCMQTAMETYRSDHRGT
jgi:hypothetical protein